MTVVISSGHGLHIRGARGDPVPPYLDEVDEARKIVERVAQRLRALGEPVITFHDDSSTDQATNLSTIVDFHNSQFRRLDVSVHLNAYQTTTKPMGVEVLYVTQQVLAAELSLAMAEAGGLINRGAKYRSDLKFLNATNEPAVLLECLFCDSLADAELYRQHFDSICDAIAEVISGEEIDEPDEPDEPGESAALLHVTGRCSWFGGPSDTGVSDSEGLAFIYDYEDAPHLFLPQQPAGTTGLARRLDPSVPYVACRWDYDKTPKGMLADATRKALVVANGREFIAWPADWGPHEDTGRVADLSPGLMAALGLGTDDEVEVIYPAPWP